MTIEEAESLGYKIVRASPIELGLIRNGVGIRTWWIRDFEGTLPSLDHPKVMEAINGTEALYAGIKLGKRTSAVGLPFSWFYSPHPQLGGISPRDAVYAGRLAEVETIIDQLESGAHA